jgi:methenyltetrahydromethanopterin cyclohydrolase
VGGLFDNAPENAARQYHALFKNGVKNHDFWFHLLDKDIFPPLAKGG